MGERAQALLLVVLAVAGASTQPACTDEVQLARERIVRPPTSPPDDPQPSAGRGGASSEEPVLARDDYCAGLGSPVAGDLLAPGPDSASCLQPAPNVFRYALCTCSDLVFTGALTADAFDSSRAPYASGQIGAGVGANGQLIVSAAIELLGALSVGGAGPLPITVAPFHVAGTLRTQGDLSITAPDVRFGRDLWVQGEILALGANATVAGDVYQPPGRALAANLTVGGTTHAQAFELAPPCPCAPEARLDVAAIVARGRATADNRTAGIAADALYTTASRGPLELACGRYVFDGGSIDDDARIVARGRTALFIAGDLAISGRFAPDLGPDGELDVFVDGALLLAPGATLGDVERPGAVRIYIDGASDLLLPGPVTLAAGLYAPNATLYLTGAQDLRGALFLHALYATAELGLHYDAALLHPVHVAAEQACGERTPRGGCSRDLDCAPPFICQAGSCSARLQ